MGVVRVVEPRRCTGSGLGHGVATLVVLDGALDSGLAGTGCSHNRGLLDTGGLGLPWSRTAGEVPRLSRVTRVDLHLVDT